MNCSPLMSCARSYLHETGSEHQLGGPPLNTLIDPYDPRYSGYAKQPGIQTKPCIRFPTVALVTNHYYSFSLSVIL